MDKTPITTKLVEGLCVSLEDNSGKPLSPSEISSQWGDFWNKAIDSHKVLEEQLSLMDDVLEKCRTQLAVSVSAFSGQDMTRHEILVEEGRKVLQEVYLKRASWEKIYKQYVSHAVQEKEKT